MKEGDERDFPLNPPTGLWHLVSLLLAQEQELCERVQQWLVDPEAPASLLAGTLQCYTRLLSQHMQAE